MTEDVLRGRIHDLPGYVKGSLLLLIWTLAFGYTAGMFYLQDTTSFEAQGIEENYLGNESDEEAEELSFKMSRKQVLNIIHSHVISYTLIFFMLATILVFSSVALPWKRVLLIEPPVSILLTFGGLWLLWSGLVWMKYVIMVSGMALSAGFYLMVVMISLDIIKGRREGSS